MTYQAGKIFPSKYLDFFVDDQPSVSQAEICFLCPFFPLGISVVHDWPKTSFVSFLLALGFPAGHQTGALSRGNSLSQIFEFLSGKTAGASSYISL